MAVIKSKLFDSCESVSKFGRAYDYWEGRQVTRSRRYTTDSPDDGIDQFEVIRRFALKGFEYGNWMSNNDRYDRLLATRDSLQDLSKVIGSKNIGLDGAVGIALGARGVSQAAAHFEPTTFMINLTKERGFGALAHEYGHALDYFFGTYVDQDRKSCALTFGRSVSRYIAPVGGVLRKLANEVVNKVIKEPDGKLSASYRRWVKEKRDSEYWFRRNEIFARTFEQWVQAQCAKKGIKNTFLTQSKYQSVMYLTKADFARVAPLISRLVREMAKSMNEKNVKRHK